MFRRNIATIICLSAVLSLSLMTGCKKKQPAKADKADPMAPAKGMKAAPTADMDPMGMSGGMNTPRPVVKPGKGRAGAMPIPYNYMVITAYLKAMRASAFYKKHEAALKKMLTGALAKRKVLSDMVAKCKVDLITGVDGVTLGHAMDNKDPEATAIIAWGGFDTAKLMACMKPEMTKQKIAFKEVTIGGKKGVELKVKDRQLTVLALSASSLAVLGKPVVAKGQAVLEGKLQSVEDTALYKKNAAKIKAKPATIISVIVPTVPASLTAKVQFPIAKKIRTVCAMIGVPADGLEANIGADFGDEKTAKTLARTLPALMGFFKAKPGAMGAKLLQNLKVKADGTWVRIALTADKATFEKLQGMAMGLVTKMFTIKEQPAPPAPKIEQPTKGAPKKGAAMKAAPKKGK